MVAPRTGGSLELSNDGCRPPEERNRLDLAEAVLPESGSAGATMRANQNPTGQPTIDDMKRRLLAAIVLGVALSLPGFCLEIPQALKAETAQSIKNGKALYEANMRQV
jgi:hypothetical protein